MTEKLVLVQKMLEFIEGDTSNREGLQDTPKRVTKSWQHLYSGYQVSQEDLKKLLTTSFSDGSCDEMVVVKDIDFYSTCEHHLLPFFGKISIGYLPNGKVLGLSKLARLVEVFSRRLQIQERLTSQIADTLMEIVSPKGVMVLCEAQHLCMLARGVEKQNTTAISSAVRGVFSTSISTKEEFIRWVRN